MSEELKYDEDKAIEFVRNYLQEDRRNKYSDDDILFIIDCMWDYYEDNGLLDLSPFPSCCHPSAGQEGLLRSEAVRSEAFLTADQ